MGRKLKGIIRDAVHGSPSGTITFTNFQTSKALRSREVETGDQACRQGQFDDTWKVMTSAMSVSSKKLDAVKQGAAERFAVHQIQEQKVSFGGDDDSVDWDDLLMPQVSKSQGDASSSSSSSMAKVKKSRKNTKEDL